MLGFVVHTETFGEKWNLYTLTLTVFHCQEGLEDYCQHVVNYSPERHAGSVFIGLPSQ